MRTLVGGQSAVAVEMPARTGAPTVGDVFAALLGTHPGIHDAALDERGAIRQHVNLFVGPENVVFGDGLATPVPDGVEVWILPAVSGG